MRRKLAAELMAVASVVLGLVAGATLEYAVRNVIFEAVQPMAVDPDRASFVHVLRLIRDALPELDAATTEPARAIRSAVLLTDLGKELNPPRRSRSYPRVVKRKMSTFKLKRPSVHGRQLTTTPFLETVQLCSSERHCV